MTFLYSFSVLFQPGIFWPSLAPYKPMFILAVLSGIAGLTRKATYPRSLALSHTAFVSLSLFLIVQVISVYYSGLRQMLDTLLYWYEYFVYMLVAVLLISNGENLFRFVWGMICGGIFIVVYGIYIAAHRLGATAKGFAAGAYGMYENHNDYTYAIILILPFIYMFWRYSSGIRRLLLLLFMVLCIVGTFLSLSRGGMISLVFEALLITFLVLPKSKRFLSLVLICVVGTSVIGHQWAKREQLSGPTYTSEDAQSSRFELWKSGWNMFVDNPVLGVGSNRFGEYSRKYYELSHDQWGKNAHNTYIQIIATNGILGIITFGGFILSMIKMLKSRIFNCTDEKLDFIRLATLISFLSLLFRALTNAKPHEWGFYMLCVIAVTCITLKTDYHR